MKAVARSDFPVLRMIQTRWSDNDYLGHVNNAVYYMYLDTALNEWLMEATGTDTRELPDIAVVASNRCDYIAPAGFPDVLQVGLATSRIGGSSITYRLAVFRESDAVLCALAEFVHVYVDRESRRPSQIPAIIRQVVSGLPSWAP